MLRTLFALHVRYGMVLALVVLFFFLLIYAAGL